ncbi:hypothetical protein [Roseovarius sp. TE539]|uniref:hypothetical protein n=1 Tax=Roseovarius sp. TE539 TaxID=2249812 RepID=UPI0015EE6196|nr:hypothetical protein [Roseovarius sp. TE539]
MNYLLEMNAPQPVTRALRAATQLCVIADLRQAGMSGMEQPGRGRDDRMAR